MSYQVVLDDDNTPVTTSLIVAEKFGKRHDNVLQAIETLDCSADFNAVNFNAVTYTDKKNESRKAYNMTRDGFVFLAMGFRGKPAAKFKEAFINEFNRMEQHIRMMQQVARTEPAYSRHPPFSNDNPYSRFLAQKGDPFINRELPEVQPVHPCLTRR